MESLHEGSTDMDARIWGNLGNYFDLAMIYNKLPMGEFFRLRQVCKEWNRLASDRKFLEDSFRGLTPKPYFVVDSEKMGHRLLARDASSGRWSWTWLPSANCAVAGLLCKYNVISNTKYVFNLHTRVFHPLPLAPKKIEDNSEDWGWYGKRVDTEEQALVGITVDTAVRPYGFKAILGHAEIGIRIYDSKSGAWTQKSSLHSSCSLAWDPLRQDKAYSLWCNGVLYFRVWDYHLAKANLQAYHLETDEWVSPDREPRIPDQTFVFCNIGAWQDRLWYVRLCSEADATIEVLEYNGGARDEDEGCWVVSGRMPEDLKTWLMAGEKYYWSIEMQGVFCGEYVLVYNCVGYGDVTERAVLCNLEGKTWEKLQLPPSWPGKVRPWRYA